MRLLLNWSVICFALVLSFSATAQDIHFSQFYLSPLTLNPALTGVTNCDIRFTANYRNQWASVIKANAYNTFQASYDQKIPVNKYDNFGIGVSFVGDQAGESSFATLSGKLTLSYAKYMGGNRSTSHYLSAGAEIGGAQRSIDFLALRYGEQRDFSKPDNFDTALPTFETVSEDNFSYLDLGAGLVWYTVMDHGTSFYVGGAYTHINEPTVSFKDDDGDDNGARLYSKITAHAGAELMLNQKIGIVPDAVIFMQGPSQEINAGLSGKYVIERSRYAYKTFQAGVWGRISNHFQDGTTFDAAIVHTRFDYNEFTFGFAYDINMSPLKPASNTAGALEFSVLYKICEGRKRAMGCPDNF